MVKVSNSLEELLGIPDKNKEKAIIKEKNDESENSELSAFLSSKDNIKLGCPEPPSTVRIKKSFEMKLEYLSNAIFRKSSDNATVLFLILGENDQIVDLFIPNQEIGEYNRIHQDDLEMQIRNIGKEKSIYGYGLCYTRPKRYYSSPSEQIHFYFMTKSQWNIQISGFPLKQLIFIENGYSEELNQSSEKRKKNYYLLSGYPCETIQMKNASITTIEDQFDESSLANEIEKNVSNNLIIYRPHNYYSNYQKSYLKPEEKPVEELSTNEKIQLFISKKVKSLQGDINLERWELEAILGDFLMFAQAIEKKEDKK